AIRIERVACFTRLAREAVRRLVGVGHDGALRGFRGAMELHPHVGGEPSRFDLLRQRDVDVPMAGGQREGDERQTDARHVTHFCTARGKSLVVRLIAYWSQNPTAVAAATPSSCSERPDAI